MTSDPLDSAVRTALATRHSHLAQSNGTALRYDPGIIPFAAIDPARPADIAALARPGEGVAFLQPSRVATPRGFTLASLGEGVQMVLSGACDPVADARIERLGPGDAAAMLALAEATRPGPFTLRAQELGGFWGIRQDGALVAMAGVRLALPGWTELSGVCVAPQGRGQGLARLLSRHVAAQIVAAGDRPFLHAYAANVAAISLYQSIGFTTRRDVWATILRRD